MRPTSASNGRAMVSDSGTTGAAADQPQVVDLLDGARGEPTPIAMGVEARTAVARDSSAPMEDRIEAFQELVDSEIGDTSVSRARNIEREHGFRQLYLKFEGGNPTGTQKDRIAFAQALDALRRGFDAITVATCGNYGAAMALAASHAGLRCIVHIPETYHPRRMAEIEQLGAAIVRTPGDYEHAVDLSREQAEREEIYDANPGSANTTLQLEAYGEIAREIYDELRDAPAAVAVPVSNGTTLAGIHRGFVSLYRRGKTSRMPQIIAGSAFNKNPIVRGFLKNSESCEDLAPESIRETAVNSPLVNWHSVDGDVALRAIRETDGIASYASDRSMSALSRTLREREGLSVLPAATAGLHALLKQHKKHGLPGDRYVAVVTGRKA